MIDFQKESPKFLFDFLIYHQTIQGHSKQTVEEYFLDLRSYLRFLKIHRGLIPKKIAFDEIPINDVTIELVANIELPDIYAYMGYLSNQRQVHPGSSTGYIGVSAAARARKVAAIRSFYKYLSTKAKLIEVNPVQNLDSPQIKKTLPKYLNIEESISLLDAVDGKNQVRDYCILALFLNCGLRISELIGLNTTDIHGDQIRIRGKGNKERLLYLNDACENALSDWLDERKLLCSSDEVALFVSTQSRKRISKAAVHKLVKKHISAAGLDSNKYSAHKLRHTAATLMLKNGVDVRTLQEVLGHDHLNTTQIYTHVDSDDLKIAAKANPLSSVKKSK